VAINGPLHSSRGISNHRLVSFSDGQITFRWRDSAHHNEQKLLTLSSDEFLRRFLLHILPKGFVRIRNFGFLANRKRAKLLHFAFTCSAPHHSRKSNHTPPAPKTPRHLGAAPNAVDR
jgi:Putative transposase